MRLSTITLALVPAALARPFVLPDLTSMQWGAIQERFGGPLKWASDAVETAEHVLGDDKTQLTIWQQIKDDDKYKTLVKILNVSMSPFRRASGAAGGGRAAGIRCACGYVLTTVGGHRLQGSRQLGQGVRHYLLCAEQRRAQAPGPPRR